MKNELETLKELRDDIDAKIEKLSELNLIINGFYEIKAEVNNPSHEQSAIICYCPKDGSFGYGINHTGDWTQNYGYSHEINNSVFVSRLRLLSHTEVRQALEKEAVKRYESVKKGISIRYKWESGFNEKSSTHFDGDYFMYKGCYVMDNKGTWATPIKTMTIEYIASKLIGLDLPDTKSELIRMKSEIIETLNNL